MKRTVRRAAAVFVASVTVQVVFLLVAAGLLDVAVASLNTALLLGSTTLLGHVFALRQHLSQRSQVELAAAAIPTLACALFLSRRLAVGAPADSLLTVAASALAIGPTARAWTHFVTESEHPAPPVYLLRVVGPALAVSLVTATIDRSPTVGIACLSSVALATLVGGGVALRARRTAREALAYATHVDRIEARPDVLVIPHPPLVADPWLVRLGERLRERSRELGEEARKEALAKTEILDARQLRTRFMASMSHELRSPLNSIVGFSQILESEVDGALTPGQRESVSMIRRSSEELIRLLTDILDLARLEAGKLKLHRVWVPSVEILTEALTRGRALVAGKEVEIEAELQPGLPPVYVDPRRIVQAFEALFRHASVSLARTTVRLRTRIAVGPPGPPRHLRVEFYDAIGALPEAEVNRIFEAFQEIAEPTGRRVGGLGMALSLSRSLVRRHGGDVWADAFPGAGTVLCIALPLDDPEDPPPL